MTTAMWIAAREDQLLWWRDEIRDWTPWSPVRWCWRHRWITAVLLAAAALLWGAAVAWADPGTGSAAGEGNPMISWMGITDSQGAPVSKYTLTLNEGSIARPDMVPFAVLASWAYETYVCLIATALWLIKFVLSFEWLQIFTDPFQTIGDGITDAMDKFGLAPTALAVLAIIVACTALAGKVAKAFSNIALGMLMIGVAATIFAHPLGELIGPDGMLAKGRDTGLEIASSVSGGALHTKAGGADTDALVSSLADRFLRKPTQMINFGEVSDSISRKCEEAWTNGIKKGRGDGLKDDMKQCDDKEGKRLHAKAMASPAAILVSLNVFGWVSLFLIAFACYFVWHVVRTAVHAMLFAALAPPAFAIGVVPGGPQTFAWKTILDCAMAYIAMIVYVAGFGAYNVILDNVFKSTNNPAKAIFITALVLAFAFAFFGPLRRMFDNTRDKMAAKLGGAPAAGGPSFNPGLLSKAADVSRLAEDMRRRFGKSDKNSESDGDPGRRPVKIDDGAPSGSGATAGDDGGSKPVRVSDDFVTQSAGTGPTGSSPTGSNSAPTGAHAPVSQPVADSPGSHKRTSDRLATAMRIYQATSGGSGSSSVGPRHAMSESAA
ncbi:hypothetical protein [Mycobacterium sp. DBP42]|uniref:hypothetical protein n=1 Tax=Mycobacteriaceae TaxID=1762 RepID=UPI00110CC1A9|nr:hypothetical protein [Mycobacterium sp. DBP42]TMS50699.1 hypothetical protein E0T84_22700 [Mycobacterium sp. DBP42]